MPGRRLPVVRRRSCPVRRRRRRPAPRRSPATSCPTPRACGRRLATRSRCASPAIGGTGVVTVAPGARHGRRCSTAGTCAALDQTGLAQKGGPVVSDLRSRARADRGANRLGDGRVRPLPRVRPARRRRAREPRWRRPGAHRRGRVVDARCPRAPSVTDPRSAFPAVDAARRPDRRRATHGDAVVVDARAAPTELFGTDVGANVLLVGAAYQTRADPGRRRGDRAGARAQRRRGRGERAGFRWGRRAVADPGALAARAATRRRLAARRRGLAARWLDVRIPRPRRRIRTAASRASTRGYVARVAERRARRVAGTDGGRRGGRAQPVQADGLQGRVRGRAPAPGPERSGGDRGGVRRGRADHVAAAPAGAARARACSGRSRSARGSAACTGCCAAMRRAAGHAARRLRLRRACAGEERALVGRVPGADRPRARAPGRRQRTSASVEIAGLPDLVRGYEQIKLRNIERFRGRAGELLGELASLDGAKVLR